MRSAPRTALAFAAALAALLGACQVELESADQVTKLRILGVQADPPEIAPGGSTAIRLLTADPKGAGRAVVGGGVVVPGQFTPSSAPDPAELPPLFYSLPFTGVNENGVVAFPSDLAVPESYLEPNPGYDPTDPDSEEWIEIPIAPPGAPLTMTAIVFVCAGDGFDEAAAYAAIAALTATGDAADLGPLAFEGVCRDAGADEGIAAVKTFDVATCDPATSSLACDGEYQANANPELQVVTLGGVPLTASEGGVCVECDAEDGCREPIVARAYLTPASFQRYERPIAANVDGTEVVYERTYVSWFTTGGQFDEERSGNGSGIDEALPQEAFEANWIPPPEGGEHMLWAVAHDVRGGVSWQIFTVNAGLAD